MLKPKPYSLLGTKVRLWLVFSQSEHWTQDYLEQGFGHVHVIIPTCGIWVEVQFSKGVTVTHLYPQSIPLDDIVAKGAEKVYYEANVNPEKERRTFGMLNCVEYTKAFMGLSNWRIMTPYQLYKEVTCQ